jgi:hypothetical protein
MIKITSPLLLKVKVVQEPIGLRLLTSTISSENLTRVKRRKVAAVPVAEMLHHIFGQKLKADMNY